jgi:hypothetical protein
MRIAELIRGILDLIDKEETVTSPEPEMSVSITQPLAADPYDEELRRFQQIAGLLPQDSQDPVVNRPQEQYADIEAVTTAAGGGMQTPKHPADIRGEHPSLYPSKVYGAR